MSHLYIFATMHHIPMKPRQLMMYQWQLVDPSSSYQWKLIDPSSSMHSHQGQYILHYINHQSINPLTSINHLTSINNINQSNHWHQWQHDPTISPFGIDGNTNIDVNTNYQLLMSTPITNYWCQHVDKECSTSIVNVNISP